MDVCARVIAANAAKIDGIKISLLDAGKEIALRARLPAGVRMYTGDDFNFAALIGGDAAGHSDALLGIFDAIAPAASVALSALAARRPRPVRRDPGADGSAVAPHLRGADALLQDGRRVHGVAQRPPVAFHDGRRTAKRAQPRRISPSCSGWPTRRRCCAIPNSRSRGCARCSRCTASDAADA